ncbi:hypothetical protein NP233_g6210 [Leucocoprinus birnbaumii]|uniref:TEA domain-containing protein n=1 Tax=Leucocoprinus birnbaumii TaxID=56174 RepID=A0AAD5VTQ3_9AGAR|nr:hypothetical protein NP233_g6210 [Leucocoprinus birnbaumii]
MRRTTVAISTSFHPYAYTRPLHNFFLRTISKRIVAYAHFPPPARILDTVKSAPVSLLIVMSIIEFQLEGYCLPTPTISHQLLSLEVKPRDWSQNDVDPSNPNNVIGRRVYRRVDGKADKAVWNPLVEAALLEGLSIYEAAHGKSGTTRTRFPGRNSFISRYIEHNTGATMSLGQVGSHLQQIKASTLNSEILGLIGGVNPKRYRKHIFKVMNSLGLSAPLLSRGGMLAMEEVDFSEASDSCDERESVDRPPLTANVYTAHPIPYNLKRLLRCNYSAHLQCTDSGNEDTYTGVIRHPYHYPVLRATPDEENNACNTTDTLSAVDEVCTSSTAGRDSSKPTRRSVLGKIEKDVEQPCIEDECPQSVDVLSRVLKHNEYRRRPSKSLVNTPEQPLSNCACSVPDVSDDALSAKYDRHAYDAFEYGQHNASPVAYTAQGRHHNLEEPTTSKMVNGHKASRNSCDTPPAGETELVADTKNIKSHEHSNQTCNTRCDHECLLEATNHYSPRHGPATTLGDSTHTAECIGGLEAYVRQDNARYWQYSDPDRTEISALYRSREDNSSHTGDDSPIEAQSSGSKWYRSDITAAAPHTPPVDQVSIEPQHQCLSLPDDAPYQWWPDTTGPHYHPRPQSVSIFQKKGWERLELTETQQRMYTAEKLENFRWISKLVATYSGYELTEKDIVDEEICQWLREVGQFAEVVYAVIPLELLLRRFDPLNQPGFPLEGYYALSPRPYRSNTLPLACALSGPESEPHLHLATSSGVRLLKTLKGQVAKLPAAIFSRWIHEHGCLGLSLEKQISQGTLKRCTCSRRRQQIIISICGTSSIQQAIHDLRAIRRPHPGTLGSDGATVHSGFWDLYQGMKSALMEGIETGLRLSPSEDEGLEALETECCDTRGSEEDLVRELVVTGHSMGGAVAHLLCLDILSPSIDPENSRSCKSARYKGMSFLQQSGLKSLEIVTFGEPRTGNQALVDHWAALKKLHQDEICIPVREWCVKAYSDGVTSLPLMKFGYRHFSQQPLYTVNGKVYRIPYDERECALFHIASPGHSSSSEPSSQTGSDPDCPSEPNTNSPQAVALYSTVNKSTGSSIPLSPLGGHNYYNERDLEGRYLRRMEWLERSTFDEEGWEERYRIIIKHHTT